MPDSGFNIMREMNETSSRTKNINTTVRAGIDYSIISKLRFVGLASYTYSTNRLKEIYGDGTKAALDNACQSVLQRNIDNDSYMIRDTFCLRMTTRQRPCNFLNSRRRREQVERTFQ